MNVNQTFYVASLSGGKDSVAMVVRLIEENRPLTHVVFYDSGMEFDSIYEVVRKVQTLCIEHEIQFVWLKPGTNFLIDMLIKPIAYRNGEGFHYGYDWCGGACRWGTANKVKAISEFTSSLDGKIVEYVGIAYDEPKRVKDKVYPLVEWKMTEADALRYCREHGFNWLEGDVDLYDVLKRVSCWCCRNKNLQELRAYYHFLPKYWELLKGLQSRIDRPFYHNQFTIFDLEERFCLEDRIEAENPYIQGSLFDFIDNEAV